MQVNQKLEQKGEQILRLLTQFYCSLSGKKEMKKISPQIRQFVMSRPDIKNKEQTAKRILDFFLRIQSKLISKSEKNWDQAFEIATARGQALVKMCKFPLRHSLNFGINRLKALNKPTRRECDTFVFDIQPQSQELEIEIQKDVKSKTYYFFKWCQYVEQSKELKKMKQREVENQKISLTFNKYGTKSNYFNAWKILYKKAKVQKDRVKKIENLTKYNLLKDCLSVIQETAAIITLQSILAKKVRQKILQIKKKDTLKKIKTNQIYIKNRAKYQKFTNSYAFMFVKHFSTKVKPMMNKSFQNLRIKFQEDSRLNFIGKIFKQYKKIYCESKEKLHKTLNFRRCNFLKNWRNTCEQSVSFIDKFQKFQSFLSIRRKRVVITVLSFNKLLKQEQFKQIQTLISNNGCSINNSSLIEVNMKKQIENKRNILRITTNQRLKKIFIKSIRSNLNLKNQKLKNESKSRQLLALRLRRRYHSYVCKFAQRTQFYDKVQRKHERVIKLSSFKSWRKLKYVKRLQQSSIDVINKYSKKLILMNFWGRLKLSAFEKNCIQKLVNSAENVIFRLAYYKLAQKSVYINENVKRIQKNGNKKITKRLFNLLVSNSKYNTDRSALIHKVNGKRCEILLLNKLKQIHSLHKKCCFIKNNLDKSKMRLFFAGLNKQHQLNRDQLLKSEKVGKKIFLVYLRKTVRAGNVINDQIYRKTEIVAKHIRESDITSFIDKVKCMNKSRQVMEEKQGKLIFKIARKRILQLKQYIECSKIEKKLQKNRNILQAKRKEQALNILTLRQKTRHTESQINKSRTINGFDDLQRLGKFNIKVNNCREYLTNCMFTKGVKDLLKIMIGEKKNTQGKIEKIQQMQENCLGKRIRLFYSLLKNNKENINSQCRLVKARKHSLFSEFMATNLRSKFSRIKFNCSLKTYARNIMKKAFKSLKQAHVKQKQKQNMIRFDKTSSILMQKSIEKSFKSNTLSQQIQRFNLRKSRHQLR